jgi:DNA-binding response OmpR family regulator
MDRRILIIEDDADIGRLVQLHLEDLGCTVQCATDGHEGLRRATSESFDLIILDIMLPGLDGLEICKRIRGRESYTPVLMLTARTSEMDRVLGLELGADDYLTKPFHIRELVARVKAILRRVDLMRGGGDAQADGPVRHAGIEIDPRTRKVTVGGKPVELTAREFELLAHFARHPGRVYTRVELLDKVWGYGHEGYEHTVNSHINRLRAKIEPDPSNPTYIRTVWGVGYKMSGPSEE